MHFCRDYFVNSVLESSCIDVYTSVLCALFSCAHDKITMLKGTS